MMSNKYFAPMCALFLFTGDYSVLASNSVMFEPKRFVFKAPGEVQKLTITNDRNSPISWEIASYIWRQKHVASIENDVLVPTDLIKVDPAFVKLAPFSSQAVHLTYYGDAAGETEGAFRIKLTSDPQQNGEISVTYTQSLPVFITPKLKSYSQIGSVSIGGGGKVDFKLKNFGNQHIYMTSVAFYGIDKSGEEVFNVERPGWYLLPNAESTYSLQLSNDDCRKSEALRVVVVYRGADSEVWEAPSSQNCEPRTDHSTGFRAGAYIE